MASAQLADQKGSGPMPGEPGTLRSVQPAYNPEYGWLRSFRPPRPAHLSCSLFQFLFLPAANPEYERCVREAQPVWFVMENVKDAPLPVVAGYQVHSQLLNNRKHGGGVQNRERCISFGTRDGRQLRDNELPEPEEWAPAVCASGGVKPGIETADRNSRLKYMGWKTKEALQQICRLQGLLVNDLKCGHFLPSNLHICPEC